MGVVWCKAHVRRGRISYVQLRATFEEYEKVGVASVARVWGESGNIFWRAGGSQGRGGFGGGGGGGGGGSRGSGPPLSYRPWIYKIAHRTSQAGSISI